MPQVLRTSQCLLLVDDHPRNLVLLEAMLAPLGRRILCAEGGEAAIALFDAEAPDLVLLDLVMPGVDGLAVLAHIRSHPERPHIPVIFVTSQNERAHRLHALEAGADEFIEKPIDRAILLARVRTLLSLKASRDQLQASRNELQMSLDLVAQRNRLLERLQRTQREFIQFIVHDLKNPLAVVAISLQCAQERVSEGTFEQLAENLAEAEGAAIRMREMVEDLLTVARLEEGDFPVRREIVSVTDFLRPIVASYTRKAESQSVSLQAPADTGASVRADPLLLRRVLENILDNALRYTPESGRVGVDARAGDDVEIRVTNTGPSVPPAERERIFEKFARGTAEVPALGNAGLGLYFCKCAVEAQGGRISVLETPEWPTCFVIQLPPPS